MTFRSYFTLILVGSLSLVLTACTPSANSGDDAKDLDYQRGKAYYEKRDFPAAIASFRKALQHNPDNTHVHYQLALLYEEKGDFLRAVDHYRYVVESGKRGPESVDSIRDRIGACTVKFVNNSGIVATPPDYKQQIDQILAEKRNIEEKLRLLQETYNKVLQANAALESRVQILQKHERELAAQLESVGQKVELSEVQPSPNISAFPQANAFDPGAKAGATSGAVVNPPVYKKRAIKKGDTLGRIARELGIPEERLLNMNPGVDPRKLQIGQEINIPE